MIDHQVIRAASERINEGRRPRPEWRTELHDFILN